MELKHISWVPERRWHRCSYPRGARDQVLWSREGAPRLWGRAVPERTVRSPPPWSGLYVFVAGTWSRVRTVKTLNFNAVARAMKWLLSGAGRAGAHILGLAWVSWSLWRHVPVVQDGAELGRRCTTTSQDGQHHVRTGWKCGQALQSEAGSYRDTPNDMRVLCEQERRTLVLALGSAVVCLRRGTVGLCCP